MNDAGIISFYFHSLSKHSGGAERMICLLSNILSDRGYIIHIITWDDAGDTSKYVLNNKIKWHKLGFKSGIINKINRIIKIAKTLKKNNIGILIGFVMAGDKVIYTAAKLAGVKLIAAERNAPSMYYIKYKWYQRWHNYFLLHLCDKVVVQFEDYIKDYPSTLRNKINSIPNIVQPASEYALPDVKNNEKNYILLAAGRLEVNQKQFDCLIHAFAKANKDNPSWLLKIYGDGPDKENLLSLIDSYNLANKIQLHESTNDIYKEYIKSNLFVIPSKWEGFPNVLSEAMSCGLPAIGFSQAEGVNELIIDGVNGWLAPGINDPDSLFKTLSIAMVNSEERVRRGINARKEIEKYSSDIIIDKWCNLLNLNQNTS